ncbi:MAG TPA: PspC domain-containing protein [Gammaproteobacteria bacterium]|nr:PspC domain-containing protein [Gammaproteobacteria bacterium]
MQRVIEISLSGHSTRFQLDEGADKALQAYLERARLRLANDPDREEVLRDLEQSIGDRFLQLVGSERRVLTRDDASAVLEQIGSVDAGSDETVAAERSPGHRRRLCRIREGQWLTGVCQGLAAYSDIRVDWVRSIFVILSVFTGGVPALIYLILSFVLPVVPTLDDYAANRYRDAASSQATTSSSG